MRPTGTRAIETTARPAATARQPAVLQDGRSRAMERPQPRGLRGQIRTRPGHTAENRGKPGQVRKSACEKGPRSHDLRPVHRKLWGKSGRPWGRPSLGRGRAEARATRSHKLRYPAWPIPSARVCGIKPLRREAPTKRPVHRGLDSGRGCRRHRLKDRGGPAGWDSERNSPRRGDWTSYQLHLIVGVVD